MKLITAIMRPEKLDELIDVIVANRAHGLTVTEVRGFGKQFGQFAASQADTGGSDRQARPYRKDWRRENLGDDRE
jgi:nitrogen regulatory protein PII